MTAIEIKELVKIYKGAAKPAVDHLCLSIEKGSFYGFLGPNGAGKTTTLSVLCGLLKATGGAVLVDGFDTGRHMSRIKPRLGLVPQDIALYPMLTARENLSFFGRMHGLRGAELKRRVDDCLDMAGLAGSADRRIAVYSGGMKRRANLVAGLVHNPPILVLDEPTVGIDAQSKNVIFESLRRLNETGTTILYATHDMESAQQLCSRVAVIDFGRILAEGPPDELINSRPGCRNLEELFLDLTGRHLRD